MEKGDTSAGCQVLLMLLPAVQSCSGKVNAVMLTCSSSHSFGLVACTSLPRRSTAPFVRYLLAGALAGQAAVLWPDSPYQKGLQRRKGSGCFLSPVAWWATELCVHSKKVLLRACPKREEKDC